MSRFSFPLILGGLAAIWALGRAPQGAVPTLPAASAATLAGEIARTHDPSRIIKCDGKYYLYHTGRNLPSRVSTDLVNWTSGATILPKIPDWAREKVPGVRGEGVWAPDLIFWKGKYWMFYSVSTFGSKTSVIGLLTNTTLDPAAPGYEWKDGGLVLATTQASDYNAIDAAPVIDANGDLYMSVGSWNAGGIKVTKLDDNGKPIGELKTIAAGQSRGPEAPYLHFRNGVFTLFANHETCCAGMNSTYRVVVGQSKSPMGPFLDKTGRDMARGGGTLFLETDGAVIGPGHVGIIPENGLDYATFHFYNGLQNGNPTLAMRTLWWDAAGWPHMGREPLPGRYALISKASGLALGVAGNASADATPLDQFAFQGAAQGWNISPNEDGFSSLRSLATGKYMDLTACSPTDGTAIVQYPWNNNDCQRWNIEQTGADTYRLISKGGKTALTIPGGAKTPQLKAVGSAWKGDVSQQWILRPLS